MSKMQTVVYPSTNTNKQRISSSSGSDSALTSDTLFSTISIFVQTSQGPNIAKSAAENLGPADTGKHSQAIPPSDEWEGEIVGEVFDRGRKLYRIVWEPTEEVPENIGPQMMKVWEEKKAKSVYNQDTGDGVRSIVRKGGIKKRPRKS